MHLYYIPKSSFINPTMKNENISGLPGLAWDGMVKQREQSGLVVEQWTIDDQSD